MIHFFVIRHAKVAYALQHARQLDGDVNKSAICSDRDLSLEFVQSLQLDGDACGGVGGGGRRRTGVGGQRVGQCDRLTRLTSARPQ